MAPQSKPTTEPVRLLQASSCFRGEVCGSLPCACAETLAALSHAALTSRVEELEKALRNVQKIISEAALVGFNHKDGDWPERLFHSQQATSRALKGAA